MAPAGSLQFINFDKKLEPDEALAQAHKEVVRMAGITRDLVGRSVKAVMNNDEREMERLGIEDENVDVVDKVLSQYLGRLEPAQLSPEALEVKSKLLYIVKDLEEIADLATRELTRIGREKSRDNVEFVDGQKEEIEAILRIVDEDIERLIVAVKGEDRSETVRVKVLERDWDLDLRRMQLFERQFARISAGTPGAEETSECYMNTINILRTAHFLITDVVRMISEPPPQRRVPGRPNGESETQQA
jgi:Na+/phosphate symporter